MHPSHFGHWREIVLSWCARSRRSTSVYRSPPQLSFPCEHECSAKSAAYDVALRTELSEVCTSIGADHIAQMVDKLTTGSFRDALKGFAAAILVENPNADFWWDYMTMIISVLCFTRARRDGSWDIHLYTVKRMLPFLSRYDHVNYARCIL